MVRVQPRFIPPATTCGLSVHLGTSPLLLLNHAWSKVPPWRDATACRKYVLCPFHLKKQQRVVKRHLHPMKRQTERNMRKDRPGTIHKARQV